MTEQEFLIRSFRSNFEELKNKKIVIYGISPNTKIIVDEFPEYNILGLMDGYQTEGELYGKKIISYDEVIELGADMIVIIARASSTKIIFKRISNFCVENDIKLYDVNGANLIKKLGVNVEDSEYFKIRESSLINEIDNHDIISFDIFDTLLMRKVLFPADVFELVEKNIEREIAFPTSFPKERMLAEYQLLSGPYPNFDMIYDNLQKNTGISDLEKEYLKELEYSIEKKVLIKRKKMVEMYQYALAKNKKVYLVSDMYLAKERMEKILTSYEITGYEDLIISCEYGTTKSQDLFNVLKAAVGNKSCIHIGDNYDADILSAKLHDMDAFEIKSGRDMLLISTYKDLMDNTEKLSERNFTGLFTAKAFNDPFSLYGSEGRLKVWEYGMFGYLFVAPLISEFMTWFIEKVSQKNYTKILFLARDGYLIDKLYCMAKDRKKNITLPEAVYFLTSRIACVAATRYEENDIKKAVEIGYDGTIDELIKRRFLLDDSEIHPYLEDEYEQDEYISKHHDKVIRRSEELRKNYYKYWVKKGMKSDDVIAVFDLAASGTCQLCLQDIFNKNMDGYYFVNIKDDNERKQSMNIDSLFKIDTWFSKEAFICESYILLESIITSADPSLQEFDCKGEPIFVHEKRNKEQLNNISVIQDSIKEYYKEYLELGMDEGANIKLADKILSFVQTHFTDFNNISIMKDQLQDEFFNRSYSFSDILD